MVTSKQRQRQLARAKWERQETRRGRLARRHRVLSIVGGVVVGLIVTALLIWLVLHIIDAENARNPSPAVPTDTFSTDLLSPSPNTQPTPTGNGQSTTSSPREQKPTKTQATKGGGS